MWHLPSDINLSRISQANIVGFSRLYCSIFDTTAGVATFGFDPPIKPGGRSVPARQSTKIHLIIFFSSPHFPKLLQITLMAK
jgi:hypothetical protein